MTKDEKVRSGFAPEPAANTDSTEPPAEPQVLAIKRQGDVWRMSKREFLKTVAAGTVVGLAGTAVGCAADDDDDAIPPFQSGGVTYRLIALLDYNATLPDSGTSLAVTAYVESDFYFRSFDQQGALAVNLHESRLADQATVGEIKDFAKTLAAKGSAEPAEQQRFAELFSTATSGTGTVSGRRMQGSESRVERSGRRMQGSTPTSTVSGRRMQGAEGRPEAGSRPQNLGTLVVNNRWYKESHIIATYTDGYTRLSHAGGEAVVQTDALPEIVQMQLPQAVANPSPRPSTVPRTTTARPARPRSPRRRSSGHYWRPN
jgi:hypothetical protein